MSNLFSQCNTPYQKHKVYDQENPPLGSGGGADNPRGEGAGRGSDDSWGRRQELGLCQVSS